MGAQQRVFRRRIRSVQATKKITRAMELIASSRIVKAQQQVTATEPYSFELMRAVGLAASHTKGKHPLTAKARLEERAAMLVITADRGLAGAYSMNAIKEGEALIELMRGERQMEVVPFIVGRKGLGFYKFREREVADSWTGFTDAPTYEDAKPIAKALLDRFLMKTEDGGADEIHIVFTRYFNRARQEVQVLRILPLEVVEGWWTPPPRTSPVATTPVAPRCGRCTTSSPAPKRCWMHCCPSTSSTWCTRRCCSRLLPSTPLASAR